MQHRYQTVGDWHIEEFIDDDFGHKSCFVNGERSATDFERTVAILEDRLNDPVDRAAEVIGRANIEPNGSIDCLGPEFMSWARGQEKATLDGQFTAKELEALAVWMRQFEGSVTVQEARERASKLDRIREIVNIIDDHNDDMFYRGQEHLSGKIKEVLDES